MSTRTARILLVADTHLGFDLPFKPRINRRRRGHDFFANYQSALTPALKGEVDLVVHGGDLLYRTRIPDALVQMAMEPLLEVAESGVPVFLVPGNHESSRIPLQIWTVHPNLHIFHKPETFVCHLSGMSIALSGFPFARRVRDRFPSLLDETGFGDVAADVHLLCLHQAIEGATVGPSGYTFRRGDDVIKGSDIPRAFSGVLAGHIHRSQILTHDLKRKPLAAPVVYPGSIERTAFAERHEDKNYAIVTVDLLPEVPQPQIKIDFVPLPARPMLILEMDASSLGREEFIVDLQRQIRTLDPDSVVRVRITGTENKENQTGLTAARIREMTPKTMNVTLQYLQAGEVGRFPNRRNNAKNGRS